MIRLYRCFLDFGDEGFIRSIRYSIHFIFHIPLLVLPFLLSTVSASLMVQLLLYSV
jgi:hypothetical protein